MSDDRPILAEPFFVGEEVILRRQGVYIQGTVGEFKDQLTIKTQFGERYKHVFLELGFSITARR